MASSHAVSLSRVPDGSFWLSPFWLPRGWASTGFVALSGVAAALVYDWTSESGKIRQQLFRRSKQLLIVMFISNIVLLISKYLVLGQISRVEHVGWWVGLFTLQTEYSISGVLLPTAVLLLLLPRLSLLITRIGLLPTFVGAAMLAVAVDLIVHLGTGVIHSILVFGPGYPIIPMALTGLLGFLAGWLIKKLNIRARSLLFIATAAGVVIFVAGLQTSTLREFAGVGLPIFRVFILAGVAVAVMFAPTPGHTQRTLGIIGRYSLFCFVGHRLLLHTSLLVGRHVLSLPPHWLYVWSMVSTFSVLLGLCWYRKAAPNFDATLKRAFL